jgi:hypothetical protein
VTDRGIGMDEPRIAAANALLARPPAPGLALSRTLGLHVVAHLAARHGIHVQLRPASPSGVTALIVLPPTLLATSHESPEPEPTQAPEPVAADAVDVPSAEPEREPVAVGVATAPFTHEAAEVSANNVTYGNGSGLTARVPGANLTHQPNETATPTGEPRPRPESVHDMLSRHERGKRDGHDNGAS